MLIQNDTAGIRHVVLDLDGTVYNGGTLFPWTRPFLAKLDALGIGFTFLTNNPSKSAAEYLAKLAALGLPATPDRLYTSALALRDFLRAHRPKLRRLFLLGTDGMRSEFTGSGFIETADDAGDRPDAVIVGFDLSLTYARLCRAAWWVKQGVPYFATNPDRVCPTDEPTVLVDCGSICAAITAATGRRPDRVFGKPDPSMLAGILARNGLRADEVVMVGDRIYTDIVMANRAGCLGVLVLSGEATRADADDAFADDIRSGKFGRDGTAPDLVIEHAGILGDLLASSKNAAP